MASEFDPKSRTAVRVGDQVIITEVYEVKPEDEEVMSRNVCIDDCNSACSVILVGDTCWGDPSGHKYAAFNKKHI